MSLIIGIDPGSTGAIAFLQDGKLFSLHDMPVIEVKVGKTMRNRISPHGIHALLKGHNPEMVVVEQVGGITGQSASAAFTFGHGAGILVGVLVGLEYPLTMLPPQRWKKAAGLPKDKGAARMRAQQLWPDFQHRFSRTKDDGRAEAALIARHYWLTVSRPIATQA